MSALAVLRVWDIWRGAPPMPAVVLYVLTPKGQEFILHWIAADPLD
jgi:hypothetical protein